MTPPLVAWLITLVTWRGSFIILGIVSLAWAAAWVWYFRDDPGEHPGIAPSELEALPPYALRKQRESDPVPWARLTWRMLPVTAVYFCYAWTLWLYLAWIPMFFLHNYKLDLRTSALFSGGVFFGGVIGDAMGGIVSDHVFRKTQNLERGRRDLVVIGFLCSLVFMTPILFVHNVSVAALCLSVAFFFSEFTIGPMWAIPMDIAPRFSGCASGLMNSGSALAAIISPLIAGYVIDKTGNWNLPFLGSIVLLLIGSVVAFAMKPGEVLTSGSFTVAKQAAD